MIVTVKRQAYPGAEPYYQSFRYDGPRNVTVAAVLDTINYTDDLFDIDGKPTTRIHWACSCMQNICGACAMVINGVPALACNTFLNELKGDRLLLEPLTKFPTAVDLIVDRSVIEKGLLEAEVYIGKYRKATGESYGQLYDAAKCLKCGLCLEVCPNYHRGERFLGGIFANQVYLARAQTEDRGRQLLAAYKEHFSSGCSKSLACQRVCPAGISTLSSMLSLNRGGK